MEYEYKVHELTVFPKRLKIQSKLQSTPGFISETQGLLRSIERCLRKADRLDLKVVGLKLSEAREALKDIQSDS
jgi:hypothetical protein